jgi:hypothetical protein
MPLSFTKGAANSLGMDIMRRINAGEIRQAPVKEIEAVKAKIIENCEELIRQGARIRPLMSGGKQIGWCRGVHFSERQMLKRWIKDPNDYILNILLLGTTLSEEEIEAMSGQEARSLTEVIQQMTLYDNSLIPYLPAYSTTYLSENLWFSQGEQLASWENREIKMPDGKIMRIMVPPDHARSWVSLCSYRDQSKKRLDDNFNSLFIVRPWAGKSAEPIQAELNRAAKGLEVDALEPWQNIVRPVRQPKDDGWAHPGDSVDDLLRELKGMMSGDKHERVMEAWQKQMEHEEEERKKKLAEQRKKRGTDKSGIVEERMEVLTEKQVKERQKALREGRAISNTTVHRESTEVSPMDRQLDKARKYR